MHKGNPQHKSLCICLRLWDIHFPPPVLVLFALFQFPPVFTLILPFCLLSTFNGGSGEYQSRSVAEARIWPHGKTCLHAHVVPVLSFQIDHWWGHLLTVLSWRRECHFTANLFSFECAQLEWAWTKNRDIDADEQQEKEPPKYFCCPHSMLFHSNSVICVFWGHGFLSSEWEAFGSSLLSFSKEAKLSFHNE